DPSIPREPFKLQRGDALLLMSDGIANFFNRAQMAQTLRGKTDAQEMLKAIQNESSYRFALFMGLVKAPINNNQRKKVKIGSFADQYMDARGKIYASKDLNDTNLIGQVGRDNVVALIYRHDPIEVSSPAASLGGAPA